MEADASSPQPLPVKVIDIFGNDTMVLVNVGYVREAFAYVLPSGGVPNFLCEH